MVLMLCFINSKISLRLDIILKSCVYDHAYPCLCYSENYKGYIKIWSNIWMLCESMIMKMKVIWKCHVMINDMRTYVC